MDSYDHTISGKPFLLVSQEAPPWGIRREMQREWDLADGNTAMDGLRVAFKKQTNKKCTQLKKMSRKGMERREGEKRQEEGKKGKKERKKRKKGKKGRKGKKEKIGSLQVSAISQAFASSHCGLPADRASQHP